MTMMMKKGAAILAPTLGLAACPALAQDAGETVVAAQPQAPVASVGEETPDDPSGLTFGGAAAIKSDFNPRGFSLSDGSTVVQGTIEAAYPISDKVNVIAGIFSTSMDSDTPRGALEFDPYVGFTGALGDGSFRVTYLRVTYPDGRLEDMDFDEVIANVTQPVGPVDLGVTLLYDDYEIGTSTWIWGSANYAIPQTPFALSATFGWEDGVNWDNKLNWSAGVNYTYRNVTFGASYVDTNRYFADSTGTKNLADADVLLSASLAF